MWRQHGGFKYSVGFSLEASVGELLSGATRRWSLDLRTLRAIRCKGSFMKKNPHNLKPRNLARKDGEFFKFRISETSPDKLPAKVQYNAALSP